MKRHLDFTIDFETCALTANAAPMQVAIVPWRRDAGEDPFVLDDSYQATEEESARWPEPFVKYVDLRTCVVDGFDFDPETVKWWAGQSEAAKEAVCRELAEPVTEVLLAALDYLRDIVAQYQLDSICLWCQGTDFDIAILRNLCMKYDVELNDIVPHTQFRDCRTLILEAAHAKCRKGIKNANKDIRGGEKITDAMCIGGQMIPCNPDTYLEHPSKAYEVFDPLPSHYADGEAHDALYDATRSSWYTWQALKWIRQ